MNRRNFLTSLCALPAIGMVPSTEAKEVQQSLPGFENIKPVKAEFYSVYEPKTSNRFIVYIQGIPAYLIRAVDRPSCSRYEGESWKWNPITIKAYDPICPNGAQMFMEYIDNPINFDMEIDILGPVGNIVEKWEISNAKIVSVNFGSMAWDDIPPDGKSKIEQPNVTYYYKGGNPCEITATLVYDSAKLLY